MQNSKKYLVYGILVVNAVMNVASPLILLVSAGIGVYLWKDRSPWFRYYVVMMISSVVVIAVIALGGVNIAHYQHTVMHK